MTERYDEVLKALQACEVDTREEEEMLAVSGGATRTIVLVAGPQAALPFDLAAPLIKGTEFSGGSDVPYPVQFGFGESFRVLAEDKDGKEHVYIHMEEFWEDLGARPRDVVRCHVDTDIPALARAELRFLVLNEDNVKRLPELAADCGAFLIVLPAGAGAPGDEVFELCRWIRDVRCLPQRAGILLNHTEMGLIVPGLPRMVKAWLGVEDAKQWKCSYQDADGLGPLLEEAVAWVLGRGGSQGSDAQADAQMAVGCVRRTLEKLDAAQGELDGEIAKLETAAQRIRKAQEGFRAYAENKGATMRFLKNDIQMAKLENDIDGLVQLLRDKLPEMLREVKDNNPDEKEAKQDMKLADEYVETVCGDYITALTGCIANSWQGMVEDTFHSALVEYRAIVTGVPPVPGEENAQSDVDILNSIQVNLGGYVDTMASTLGSIVGKVLSVPLAVLAWQDETGVVMAVYYSVRGALEQVAGAVVEILVDAVMPANSYAKHLAKALEDRVFDPKPQGKLSKLLGQEEEEEEVPTPLAQKLKENLKVNILPVAESAARRQYQNKVDATCGVLGQNVADTLAQRDKLADKRERLQQQAETLQSLL